MNESLNRSNPNRARDHLANERTYLAWMRTAVAMMGLGVVIARLRFLVPPEAQAASHGWQLGVALAVIGVLLVPFSTVHYFLVRRAIDTEAYEPLGRWVAVLSIAVLLIGAGILYVLFSAPAEVGPPLPF